MRALLVSLVLFALTACCGGPSQAEGDAACRSADVCTRYGGCWYNPKTATMKREEAEGIDLRQISHTGVYESQCEARTDADCEQTTLCRLDPYRDIGGGTCYRNMGGGGMRACRRRLEPEFP